MGNHQTIMKKIKKALISVSDKKNLKNLLKVLTKNKIELIIFILFFFKEFKSGFRFFLSDTEIRAVFIFFIII